MNVLKSTSLSYVRNMIENIILTSYSDKSHLVASSNAYVTTIQMMSHDNLKHQVSQQPYHVTKFVVASLDVTLYHDGKTDRSCSIHIFSLTACQVLQHVPPCFGTFVRYIIKHLLYEYLFSVTFLTEKLSHSHRVYLIDPSEPAEIPKIVHSAGSEGRNPNKYEFRKRQTLVELP